MTEFSSWNCPVDPIQPCERCEITEAGWRCIAPSTINQKPSNVTPLFGDRNSFKHRPLQPDLIATLAQLLAEAQSGTLTGLALVAIYGDRFASGTFGNSEYTTYLGAVTDLQYGIMWQKWKQDGKL